MVYPTWEAFKDVFFHEWFPNATREQMTSDWLNLMQGNKTVGEYEAEFSCLLKFTIKGHKENERMKVQKFQNRLNPEIRHDIKLFELNTLLAVVGKARLFEKNKSDCRR